MRGALRFPRIAALKGNFMRGIKIVGLLPLPAERRLGLKLDPLWIRRSWVGLEISFGPLSNYARLPEDRLKYEPAVIVAYSDAMTALRKAGRTRAEQWWRRYTEGPPGHFVSCFQFNRDHFEFFGVDIPETSH